MCARLARFRDRFSPPDNHTSPIKKPSNPMAGTIQRWGDRPVRAGNRFITDAVKPPLSTYEVAAASWRNKDSSHASSGVAGGWFAVCWLLLVMMKPPCLSLNSAQVPAGDHATQFLLGSQHVGFHGTQRAAQNIGRLFVRQVLIVALDDGRAFALGKGG